jgi:hypothetical protein
VHQNISCTNLERWYSIGSAVEGNVQLMLTWHRIELDQLDAVLDDLLELDREGFDSKFNVKRKTRRTINL